MNRILTLLILATSAHALTLADYPSMFFTPDFNASIILPDTKDPSITAASNYLITHLPEYTIRLGRNKTHATSSEIRRALTEASNALTPIPAIIFGTPCNNPYVRRALPTIPCTSALEPNTARIILREGPTLTITADKNSLLPKALSYLHESAVQYNAQEIHLAFDHPQPVATIYRAIDSEPYSIRNTNGTRTNDHTVRKTRYGTTIKN